MPTPSLPSRRPALAAFWLSASLAAVLSPAPASAGPWEVQADLAATLQPGSVGAGAGIVAHLPEARPDRTWTAGVSLLGLANAGTDSQSGGNLLIDVALPAPVHTLAGLRIGPSLRVRPGWRIDGVDRTLFPQSHARLLLQAVARAEVGIALDKPRRTWLAFHVGGGAMWGGPTDAEWAWLASESLDIEVPPAGVPYPLYEAGIGVRFTLARGREPGPQP